MQEINEVLQGNALIAQLVNDLHGAGAAQGVPIAIVLLDDGLPPRIGNGQILSQVLSNGDDDSIKYFINLHIYIRYYRIVAPIQFIGI